MDHEEYQRRIAEPPYREVRRKNLDRIGALVLESMMVAGCASLPDGWNPILEEMDRAYGENPELLVVLLWRSLCNYTAISEKAKPRGN